MPKPNQRLPFAEARAVYVHRFTMEHVPEWARRDTFTPAGSSEPAFYAPHFATDDEWYRATIFPGDTSADGAYLVEPRADHCHTGSPSWPLGKALPAPYRIGQKAGAL